MEHVQIEMLFYDVSHDVLRLSRSAHFEQMPPNITALNYISRFWPVGMMIE